MTAAEITRIFLVGCPRSGTTLLQSMLGAHSGVYTIPETHFFSRIFPRNPLLRKFHLTDRNVRSFFRSKVLELDADPNFFPIGFKALFLRNFGRGFCKVLDTESNLHGKYAWVEKTPQHLHRITHISASIPTAKFVHVIRPGTDTIASLYHVTNEFPDQWGGSRTLHDCIERWVSDITESARYVGHPQHHYVLYEDLVRSPESTLLTLTTFLGLAFEPQMIEEYSSAYRRHVAERGAEWTANAGGPLDQTKQGRKFHEYLSIEQQAIVEDRLRALSLSDVSRAIPLDAPRM